MATDQYSPRQFSPHSLTDFGKYVFQPKWPLSVIESTERQIAWRHIVTRCLYRSCNCNSSARSGHLTKWWLNASHSTLYVAPQPSLNFHARNMSSALRWDSLLSIWNTRSSASWKSSLRPSALQRSPSFLANYSSSREEGEPVFKTELDGLSGSVATRIRVWPWIGDKNGKYSLDWDRRFLRSYC